VSNSSYTNSESHLKCLSLLGGLHPANSFYCPIFGHNEKFIVTCHTGFNWYISHMREVSFLLLINLFKNFCCEMPVLVLDNFSICVIFLCVLLKDNLHNLDITFLLLCALPISIFPFCCFLCPRIYGFFG
jgi:hypothetical protein